MVPVFSWLVLGGKCRNCKSEISVQYPIIEGVNGILYVVIFAVNGLVWSSVIYCLMASALLVLSVIDWRTYEIPFGINVFLFVLGIAMAVLPPKLPPTGHTMGGGCHHRLPKRKPIDTDIQKTTDGDAEYEDCYVRDCV